jgi:putative N6-adenine-specific DNA methylase
MIPKNIERRIRQHVQAKKNDFFAVVQPGFENTAFEEMKSICIELPDAEIITGGIEFRAGINDVWKLNFTSRCLTRILMRLGHFRVLHFNKFREKIAAIPWELYLMPGKIPVISIKCRRSKLYHTGRIEIECLAGINYRMESIYSTIAKDRTFLPGNQTVYIRFENDVCTVSMDTTGEPLYRRGIRTHIAKAPLRETLASCILHEAELEKFEAVLDPMCGSGVIPLEAMLISKGIPAGAYRNFAFEEWPGHRPPAFEHLKKSAIDKGKCKASGFAVYASDISEQAIEITRYNAESSGFACDINISSADFFSLRRDDFQHERMLIVSNPPYGGRISVDDISGFYQRLGEKLRRDFSGTFCAFVVPGLKAEKALGIFPIKRIPFINGGIRVILLIGSV